MGIALYRTGSIRKFGRRPDRYLNARRRPSLSRLGGSDASPATLHCSDAIDAKRHARYAIDARRAGPKNNLPQKPYDDPKFASHVLYLSANSLADGFVPFNANDTSSCVTRFAPINF